MGRPTTVDVLILRAHSCDSDPRVEKVLWHYRDRLGLAVGLVCTPRYGICDRNSDSATLHMTFPLRRELHETSMPRMLRRVRLLKEQVGLRHAIRSTFRPKVIHGCDLDGYTSSRIAFPAARQTIFEMYDSWTTMSSSSLSTALERRAISTAAGLILPANEMRIHVERDRTIVMQNFVDPGLARREMASADLPANLPDRYLLAGGTRTGSRIDELASLVLDHPEINLVIAESEPPGWPSAPNVKWIGRQPWGTWLRVLSQAAAVWTWYDSRIEHYKSHLSPNKYWEACLLDVPLIINSPDQFCDRSAIEPVILAIGDFLATPDHAVGQIASLISGPSRPAMPDRSLESWTRLEDERTQALARLLADIGLGSSLRVPSSGTR